MAGWKLWVHCALFCYAILSMRACAASIEESLETLSLSLPTETEMQRNQMDMLVMVGSVSTTSARVVYEPLVVDESPIKVSLVHEDIVLSERKHPQHQAFPYAIAFNDLNPNATYYVTFHLGDTLKAVARFRTPALDISMEKLNILTVSCDRYLQDSDDSHWKTLVQEVRDPNYFGTVHTGDQIYADGIVSTFQQAPFDSVLRAFRGLYRRSFGRPLAQRVLRQGAHYMLIDDHDIINNWSRNEFISQKDITRAGLQAYYEFQYQLLGDLEGLPYSFQGAPKAELYRPTYHSISLGTNQLKLVFLDTRLERGLMLKPSQLISSKQISFLEREIVKNSSELIVFSALPLFFHTKSSALMAEYFDKEFYPGHAHFQSTLEKIWSILPSTSLLLVAGDLHMAHGSTVCDRKQSKCIPQIISSGMTQGSTAMEQRKIVFFHYLVTQWFQKLGCLASMLMQTSGGVCVHTETTYYGQNYAKITWDHGDIATSFVTKPYEEPVDQFIQVFLTYILDFRAIAAFWAIVLLRWFF